MGVVNCRKTGQYHSKQDILHGVEQGQLNTVEALKTMRELVQAGRYKGLSGLRYGDTTVDQLFKQLHELIGLTNVKKFIAEMHAYIEVQKHRKSEQLATEPLVLHMIFKGNPGTGKTTVARLIGRMFQAMGVLPKGHLIEVERADLVGEYIGHTAQKTREQIKKAMGGILFIDEAYSLARGGEKDFGKECIDCLVKAMEDYKNDIILILAGYRHEMERFLLTNPGLKSRFPVQLDFPDYSREELMNIARSMLAEKQYCFSQTSGEVFSQLLKQAALNPINFGNARLVRNLLEQGIRRQAVRLVSRSHLTRQELMLLQPEDFAEVEI